MSNVLVVAVHPDDETLGCGATLLKHRAQKDKIYWLILTEMRDKDGWDKKKMAARRGEIEKAAKAYEFVQTFQLGFPTTRLDTIPMSELVHAIGEVVKKVQPQVMYLPNRSDIHSDHQIAFQAAVSCTKNFRFPSVKRVLMYETPSETDFAPALPENAFIPNVFVDVTPYLEKKLKIMSIFASEVMRPPYPRSLKVMKALAQVRGSRIGKEYAESFMLIQEIL